MSNVETPRNPAADGNPEGPLSPALAIENIVKCYGDLLFDLCESILWSAMGAQIAFRSIVKEIRKRRARETYIDHERAWILSIACEKLRAIFPQYGRKLVPSEQIALDSLDSVPQRLKQFDQFFHRLSLEDQLLLLLKDKYGIPMSEIATALSTPEGSLKIRRAQSLRALEDWLWEQST